MLKTFLIECNPKISLMQFSVDPFGILPHPPVSKMEAIKDESHHEARWNKNMRMNTTEH
jgi:hypothetical protein